MTGQQIRIEDIRQTLDGSFVSLIPVNKGYSPDIVALRNTERAKSFLNQSRALSIEEQDAWVEQYEKRDNDAYWCILDKSGEFLGTYRIYDIDFEARTAEVGSVIIREERAMERPYFLEATLLVYSYVFSSIGLERLIAHTKEDNAKTRAFNAHLGAITTGETEIAGEKYIVTEVSREGFRSKELYSIIDHWKKRESKLAGQAK